MDEKKEKIDDKKPEEKTDDKKTDNKKTEEENKQLETIDSIKSKLENTISLSCELIFEALLDGVENKCTKAEIYESVNKKITEIKTKLSEDIDALSDEDKKSLDEFVNKITDDKISLLIKKLSQYKINVEDTKEDKQDKKEEDIKPAVNYNASSSDYLYKNVSYSGTDIVVTAQLCIGNTKSEFMTIGSLQTITYSVYDRMEPIHSLGNVNAKDYVHTHRYIAGSMVFAVFDQHWAKEFIEKYCKSAGIAESEKILTDEIPPMNITISMGNEYGSSSRTALYGVRLFNEGMTMSVNDIYTEHTYQFVALNIDYLENVQLPSESRNPNFDLSTLAPKEIEDKKPQQINESTDKKDEDNDNDKKDEDSSTEEDNRIKINGLSSDDYINNAMESLSKNGKKVTLSKIQNKALDDVTKDYKKELKTIETEYKEKIKKGEATKVDLENKKAQLKKDWKDIKTEIKIYINTAKREVSDLEE